MLPDPEEAIKMGQQILDESPELSVDISTEGTDEASRQIRPDVGVPSPIEIYESSVVEQRVREDTGLKPVPIERHPGGHKQDPDDGRDRAFGNRAIDQREAKDGMKDRPKVLPELVVYSEMPKQPAAPDTTVEVSFRYQGH
jgi:hypothetical protein